MHRASPLPLLLSLLATSTALAHDTLPKQWCQAGTQLVIVGQFSFSERQLREYRASHLADTAVLGSTCSTVKTCGIIDEWYWANQMAHEYALDSGGGHALRSGDLSMQRMPIVRSPKSFSLNTDVDPSNGILDHHDRYRFSQGLIGDYAICRPITTVRGETTGKQSR